MDIDVKQDVLLAPYTVYKIGGPARFFVEAKNADEVKEVIKYAAEKQLSFFILGAGSNILVSDKGFDGMVIRMVGGGVRTEGESLIADAGAMMARVVTEAAKAGLAGFEWGIGVPGTIGGSVRGNAGCFGNEMKDVMENVLVLQSTKHKAQSTNKTQNPKQKTQTRELINLQCEFSYRDSVFKRHPAWIILSATLKLAKGDPAEIQKKIRAITQERVSKQDIGTKSCGCIFKNILWMRGDIDKEKLLAEFPELTQFKNRPNIPASFLLDASGCKGLREGSVVVSPKHANFFVNEGGATAKDVCILIQQTKEQVQKKFGIALEEEIQFVGF